MIALPVDIIEPFHDFTIELDGLSYTFQIRYHSREERYYFSLYRLDGTPLQLGTKVLCDQSLLRGTTRRSLPGQIFARSNAIGNDSPPTLGELGSPSENVRVNLFYLNLAEVTTLVGPT